MQTLLLASHAQPWRARLLFTFRLQQAVTAARRALQDWPSRARGATYNPHVSHRTAAMAIERSASGMAGNTDDNDAATPSSPKSADEEASMDSDDRNDMAKPRPSPFIVRFYGEGHARDAEGRTLDDICAFDDNELEYHHDFIQVIFPLPERSGVNWDAPLIDEDTRDAFLAHEHLRKRLFTAFCRMARFYAFDVEGDETNLTLSPTTDFKKQARNTWLTSVDHNHLRITRIIRCLRLLGLDHVARTFHQALVDNARGVSSRSLMYWERAAKRPLCLAPDQPDGSSNIIRWLET